MQETKNSQSFQTEAALSLYRTLRTETIPPCRTAPCQKMQARPQLRGNPAAQVLKDQSLLAERVYAINELLRPAWLPSHWNNGGAYIYVPTLETATLTPYEHLPMKTSPSPEHKFITEPQYLELCKACDQILRAQDSTAERVAISWLHVIREHPAFLPKYMAMFESRQNLQLFF